MASSWERGGGRRWRRISWVVGISSAGYRGVGWGDWA